MTVPVFLSSELQLGLGLAAAEHPDPVVERVSSLDNRQEIWFGC